MNNVYNLQECFYQCRNIKKIYIQNNYVPINKVSSDIFYNCTSLVGGAGTKFDPTFIDSTGARIDGGSSNPGYFTAISQKPIETGTVLNIEGSDYIVVEQKDTNKFLVTSKDAIGKRVYCEDYDSNTYLRKDGKYANTYEDSEIDNYLENIWYKQLSERLQNAIDITEIKQGSYKLTNGHFEKQDIGYNNEIYNKIYRHVYLFSLEELSNLVNMSNGGNVNEFIHYETTWTRDSYQTYGNHVINLHSTSGPLSANKVENPEAIRPAFVIDLSKVDYTVTGTVNYK